MASPTKTPAQKPQGANQLPAHNNPGLGPTHTARLEEFGDILITRVNSIDEAIAPLYSTLKIGEPSLPLPGPEDDGFDCGACWVLSTMDPTDSMNIQHKFECPLYKKGVNVHYGTKGKPQPTKRDIPLSELNRYVYTRLSGL